MSTALCWKNLLKFMNHKVSHGNRRRSLLAGVESLEQRQLMATRVWDGGSVTSDAWTNRFNWEGNDAPVSGDSLVFPDSIRFTDRGLNNDFPTGTDFKNITIEGQAYLFRGNRIDLQGNLTYNPKTDTTIDNTKINLDIRFLDGDHTINIIEGINSESREELEFNGSLTATGSGTIHLTGKARVIFGGNDPNDFNNHTLRVDTPPDEEDGPALVLNLDKRDNVRAIAGALTIGTEVLVRAETNLRADLAFESRVGQIAPDTEIILNIGGLSVSTETLNNLTLNGGSFRIQEVLDRITGDDESGIVTLGQQVNIGGIPVIAGGGSLDSNDIPFLKLAENTTFNISDSSRVTINATLTGGNLIQTGTGNLILEPFESANQHNNTIVNGGSLNLKTRVSGTNKNAIPKDLIVSGSNSKVFINNQENVIADTSDVILENDAFMQMSNRAEDTIGSLKLSGDSRLTMLDVGTDITVLGTAELLNSSEILAVADSRIKIEGLTKLNNSIVESASGTIFLNNVEMLSSRISSNDASSVMVLGGNVTVKASAVTSAITGVLRLTQPVHEFNLENGAANNDLDISARLAEFKGEVDGTSSIVKKGLGRMLMSGNNSYAGTTTVNQGTLVINGIHNPNQEEVIVNAGILTGRGQVSQIVQKKGFLNPGFGPGVITATESTTFGSDAKLVLQLNSATQFDQLRTGELILNNPAAPATLDVRLAFTPNVGQKFRIVDITGTQVLPADQVFRDLQGNLLPEGSRFTVNGLDFTISYVGGTGNDVVITRNTPPAFRNISITPQVNEGEKVFITGTITEPNPNDTFLLDVDWGDGTLKTYYFPPGSPRTVTAGHIYADDRSGNVDTYPVSIHWRDQFGGTNGAQLSTLVRNSAPKIEDITLSLPPIHAGEQFTLQGLISDHSSQDTFKAYVQWTTGGAWEAVNLAAGATTFTFQHSYAATGNYNVTVLIIDDDLGIDQQSLTIRVV